MEMLKLEESGHCRIQMRGRFTFSDNPEFREVIQMISSGQVSQMMLDISRLDFVDSAALGMLLLARDEAEKHRIRLTLSEPVGQVKKIFNVVRFDELFTIV
ncbi:MAG: STAS domain-containing protein [Alphaproteobacteria bacterium]|nr:STAS domain-containing protein [Alphaproteobacteria bacterium]